MTDRYDPISPDILANAEQDTTHRDPGKSRAANSAKLTDFGVVTHPSLHLLALERTGWRRWVLGRWVYNSEPFRRDIQRQLAAVRFRCLRSRGETYGPEWEASEDDRNP